jgi:membrane-bound lytic murein transglycosylase B
MLKRYLVSLCLGISFLYGQASFADMQFVDRPDVQVFINKMVKKHGFDHNHLVSLFNTVKIRPQVIKSIKAPMEQIPWYSYQTIFLTQSRIQGGVDFWNKHSAALNKAEKIYGVPASIIVATIGVETKYGKNKGEYPVIDALTNIAFSSSTRSPFFKSELEEFLLLTREQHLNPLTIKGSYAGAMGQPQFMPSSYRYYAVSFSGKQSIDLTNNVEDIIVSIANYYKKHGWKTNQPVAIPTTLAKNKSPVTVDKLTADKITKYHLAQQGIYPKKELPANQSFKMIELRNHTGNEYWVGMHNFEVIKRYNPSNLYAMVVYQLSYHIQNLRSKTHHG